MAVPGGGAAWCCSPARTGPLRDTEAWSQHHRQRRRQLGQPRLRSEKNPSPRAVGQSQGTKRFGTWELQVKLSALPTGRWHGPLWPVTRAPQDGGPGPRLATPIAELREVLLNGIGYRLSNSRSRTRPRLPDVAAGKALLGSGLTLKRQRVKVEQSRIEADRAASEGTAVTRAMRLTGGDGDRVRRGERTRPRRPAELEKAQGSSEPRPRGSGQTPPFRLAPPRGSPGDTWDSSPRCFQLRCRPSTQTPPPRPAAPARPLPLRVAVHE